MISPAISVNLLDNFLSRRHLGADVTELLNCYTISDYERCFPMKIAVFGATGQIGRRCCDFGLEKNYQVTALVRDAARFPSDLKDRVRIVEGDAGNAEAVANAVRGQDAVVCCLG